MTPALILTVILVYFGALLTISYFTSRNADSNAFFTGNKQSPWYLVAFGMIGTSISGVTFISVPGAVGATNKFTGHPNGFAYFQIVIGYMIGYFVIATVLMPLYYRLNLISIYTYLEQRFGLWSYKTGAFFFLISRTIGSALRLFLAANVLQMTLFKDLEVPFIVTVAITILLIWVYTFKGGIKTIVWTDSFQTIFLVSAVIISVYMISDKLNFSLLEMVRVVGDSDYSKIFNWDSVNDTKYFPKQLLAGAALAIAMTGLDQDLMQKNISCKNIKEAQKNMFWFSISVIFVNLLFLTVGALLYIYSTSKNIPIPALTDELYPKLALQLNEFGMLTAIFFLLGIIASSYASADSALAALTTSFCVDFLNFKDKTEKQKQNQKLLVHIGFSLLFLIIIVVFKEINKKDVIDTVLDLATYTYGPLVGLFSFGLMTKRKVKDKLTFFICLIPPVITYLIKIYSPKLLNGYSFGYEILLINGLLTYGALWLISEKDAKHQAL
jgi:Na+/proline symporter